MTAEERAEARAEASLMTVAEAEAALRVAIAAYAAGGGCPYELGDARRRLLAATYRKHMMLG